MEANSILYIETISRSIYTNSETDNPVLFPVIDGKPSRIVFNGFSMLTANWDDMEIFDTEYIPRMTQIQETNAALNSIF